MFVSFCLRNGNAKLLVLRATSPLESQNLETIITCPVLTVPCILCRKPSSHGDVGPQKVVARAFLDS